MTTTQIFTGMEAPAGVPTHIPLALARARALSTALRASLLGPLDRARHPRAMARRLGPGLFETVVLERRPGQVRIPEVEQLGSLGLGPAAVHRLARANTRALPISVAVVGPRPGVRLWMIGALGHGDGATAALELPRILPGWGEPAGGYLLAVPVRGTALCLPLGADLTERARVAGCLGDVRAPDPRAPLDVYRSADFLAAWAADLHARMPAPVTGGVFWVQGGRFTLVPRGVRRGRVELRPGMELRAALSAAQPRAVRA